MMNQFDPFAPTFTANVDHAGRRRQARHEYEARRLLRHSNRSKRRDSGDAR